MLHVANDMTERRFTFKDMKDGSSQAANYFTSLGIKRGDRVMLVLKRHYQFWFAILGLHKLGAIAIPATNQLMEHDFTYRFKAAGVSAIDPISRYYLRSFAVVFLIGIVGATPLPKRAVEQLGSTRAGAMVVDVLEPLVLVSVLAVSTGYLVDGSFNPFLYFRF